jgi:hypothetical protein
MPKAALEPLAQGGTMKKRVNKRNGESQYWERSGARGERPSVANTVEIGAMLITLSGFFPVAIF